MQARRIVRTYLSILALYVLFALYFWLNLALSSPALRIPLDLNLLFPLVYPLAGYIGGIYLFVLLVEPVTWTDALWYQAPTAVILLVLIPGYLALHLEAATHLNDGGDVKCGKWLVMRSSDKTSKVTCAECLRAMAVEEA